MTKHDLLMYNEHLTPSFVFDRYILGEVMLSRER